MTNLEQRPGLPQAENQQAERPAFAPQSGTGVRVAAQGHSGRPDIELVVPGEPKGKARPRFNRATGTAYTPTPTLRAEHRIQLEWIAAGRPVVEGPLAIDIEAVLARPQGHYKKDGSLSTAGERMPHPSKKPDWDNLGKLVADALNGLAYTDDSQIVLARLQKRWATPEENERTRICIYQLVHAEQAVAA